MALHIRDDRAAVLARRLARRKGMTMTRAVVEALEGAPHARRSIGSRQKAFGKPA